MVTPRAHSRVDKPVARPPRARARVAGSYEGYSSDGSSSGLFDADGGAGAAANDNRSTAAVGTLANPLALPEGCEFELTIPKATAVYATLDGGHFNATTTTTSGDAASGDAAGGDSDDASARRPELYTRWRHEDASEHNEHYYGDLFDVPIVLYSWEEQPCVVVARARAASVLDRSIDRSIVLPEARRGPAARRRRGGGSSEDERARARASPTPWGSSPLPRDGCDER